MNEMICEDLLTSWLTLSAVVRNERLVTTMTFREMLVCHILSEEFKKSNQEVTATDIVNRTGMLKSQANKVIVSLESSCLLTRIRSSYDKRQVYLALTPLGNEKYQAEHKKVLALLDQLTNCLGESETAHLTAHLTQVSGIMQKILS